MITRRFLLGALGTLPLARIAFGEVVHRITILHLNDFHSRHDPVDTRALSCVAGDGCYGGSPRLATAIAAQRQAAEADGRAVLQLDAGDQFQGSLFYTALHGDAELAVMHAVGTAAMAVGNHEFDNGPANLARFIRAARFPVLSANIDAGRDPDLAGLIQPFALFERAGVRIGVVGLTTQETLTSSSPGPHVAIGPPQPALVAAVAACRAGGAKFVVALSHVGLAMDRAMAGTVPGLGVIVGGHSHSLLSNTEPGALGPHPTVIDGAAGRTLVVQAAAYGRYLGRLDLDLAEDGTVLGFGGECRHIGFDVPPDPAVAAIVAGFAAPLDAMRHTVVGHTEQAADIGLCRLSECPLGNLVAEAMLTGDHGAQIALANAGGLRTGLPAGDVTMGDVIGMLPFGNTLATLKLHGADIRAAVLHGLSLPGRGAFLQTAGLRIEWDPADPARTLIAVQQRGGGFAPLDDATVYGVATNNFMRAGGDGYTMLRDGAIDPYDSGPGLEALVADRLGAVSPYRPVTDGRLVLR